MAHEETYEQFIEKFKPKKTTDDCYTPPEVYNAVLDWAIKEYGWAGREVVRPFYPGGDYVNFDYPKDCVVIDNPPFSIISQIARFYEERGISYFLFAPHLTLFSIRASKSHIGCGVGITYTNGARVNTSFVCSEGPVIRSAPSLYTALEQANNAERAKGKKHLPTYKYPDELITPSSLQSFSKYGIKFATDSAEFVSRLDAQIPLKKTIFGGGYLVKPKEIKEVIKKMSEIKNNIITFRLSNREKEIVENLKN